MNPRSTIDRIARRLQDTPRRVAIKEITWLHRPQKAVDPDPLEGLLKSMKTQLEKRIPANAESVYASAVSRVFFLINLYILAMSHLFEEMSTCMQLSTFTLAYVGLRKIAAPWLCLKLVDAYKSLYVWTAVIDIVRKSHFHTAVGPRWLDPMLLQVHTQLLCACVEANNLNPSIVNRLDQEGCIAQAKAVFAGLERSAHAAAGRIDCGVTEYFLRSAERTLIQRFQYNAFALNLMFEDRMRELIERRAHAAQPVSKRGKSRKGNIKHTAGAKPRKTT